MRSALAEDTLPNLVSPPPSRPVSRPVAAPSARPAARPAAIVTAPPRSVGPGAQVNRPQPAAGKAPGAARPQAGVSGVHAKAPPPAPRAVSLPPPAAPSRASYAPPARPSHIAPRPVRPLPTGGPAPTVIRDLDALFARDGRKSARPAPRPAAPTQPPIEPARFAQMLLQKVEADFTPARHNAVTPPPARPAAAPLASAPAPFAAPLASAPAPAARVAFVPSPVAAPAMLETLELALPADDEDLAQLVPWYRRLWNRLFR